MAIPRPNGVLLPLGNKPAGFQFRTIRFPGAGERAPQRPSLSGAPAGRLATPFGASGFTIRGGGRTSVKRSFQPFTRRRVSPFFNLLPAGLETPQGPSPFAPTEGGAPTDRANAGDVFGIGGGLPPPASDRRRKVKLTQLQKKQAIQTFKSGAPAGGGGFFQNLLARQT